MELNRRQFVNLATGSVATCLLGGIVPTVGNSDPPIKAIAFDGFTTFDPRSVFALAEELFPGRGSELSNAWRTRQFEYTWLRTVCGHYADFWKVTEEALVFATNMLKLELSLEKRQHLMQAFLELKSYPDALPALKSLRAAGIRLAFLSNLTPYMLDSAN